MHGGCLVRTPVRPWSPPMCNNAEMHNDSGISPGGSSSAAPSNSPESPRRNRGSPGPFSGRTYQNSPNSPVDAYHRNSNSGSPVSEYPASAPMTLMTHYPAYPSASPPHTPENSLERLQMALEQSTAFSGVYKSDADMKEADHPDNASRKEFPCPLCAYSTPYRHRYMEHVSTHYSDKCTLCDFKGENIIDLRNHLSEVHGVTGGDLSDLPDSTDQLEQTSDGLDDDDNSRRGKSKNFRCKQCAFVTNTKVDFWEHTKTHIKAEKLLTCPKCPFVTEYKHHLEYHLRNHFGSKPFKCNKCSYSCVNKSMLNSHLKSHSNVYQYRCADCAYATKYCHSLKLHLRKYDHNPSMVLNQDGSPNPLPIIDVYGTRRGPKQKPKTQEELEKSSLPGGIVVPPAPVLHSEEPRPKLMGCNLCDFYTGSMEILNQHMYAHASESPFAHLFRTNNNVPDQGTIKEYLHNVFMSMEPPVSPLSLVSPNHSPAAQPASPLDLSKSDTEQPRRDERKNRRKGKAYKLERHSQLTDELIDKPISMVKRELIEIKSNDPIDDIHYGQSLSNGEKMDETDAAGDHQEGLSAYELCETKMEDSKPDIKLSITALGVKEERLSEPEVQNCERSKSDSEGYNCDFCDMAFKDVVMYTMHMGYHGYRNPFTCNMCGQETANRVSFFLHIARQPHT